MRPMLRKSILILAAALSPTAFASDARLGPELPMIPFSYPYSRSQGFLHSAAAAGHFLTVWSNESGEGIDGLLDGRLLTIVPYEPNVYARPVAVAGGNDSFLVMWTRAFHQLAATRVAFDGTIIDSTAIIVRDNDEVGGISDLRVTFNGTAFVVVWAAGTLHTANIAETDGSVMTNDLAAPPVWGAPRSLQILTSANEQIVVYSLERFIAADPIHKLSAAIGAVVLDRDGLAARETIFPVFDSVGLGMIRIAAARAGDTITIAWPTADDLNAIAVAQVTTAGVLLSGPRLLRPIAPGEYVYIADLQMLRDGEQYVLCWIEGSTTGDPRYAYRAAGLRLDRNANAIEPAPFTIADLRGNPYLYKLDLVDTLPGIIIAYTNFAADGRAVAYTRTLEHSMIPARRRSARP